MDRNCQIWTYEHAVYLRLEITMPLTIFRRLALLACLFTATGLHAQDPVPYDAPKSLVMKFTTIAGSEAIGRIKRIDYWHPYAKKTCNNAPMCEVLARELRVAVVDVAKSNDEEISWAVIIHYKDRLTAGDFLRFKFPSVRHELGDARGRIGNQPLESVPSCQWSVIETSSPKEGVVCDSWKFTALSYPW